MNFLQWLEKEGITKYRFAKMAKISVPIIYCYAAGQKNISRQTAIKCSEITKGEVSESEFMFPSFEPCIPGSLGRPKKVKV